MATWNEYGNTYQYNKPRHEDPEKEHLKFVNLSMQDELRRKDDEIARLREQLMTRLTAWELLLKD
jgi:hypothetical protein